MPGDISQLPDASPPVAFKYEAGDPPAGWIVAGGGLVLLMLAAGLLVGGILLASWTRGRPIDPEFRLRGSIVAPGNELLARFPKPNLQINPQADLLALRARETSELESYGWMDRKAGRVRIPIDRAMDLLVLRGLPTRDRNQPPAVGPSEYDLAKERQAQP